MSETFALEVEWLEGSEQEPVEQSTFAEISILAGREYATELEDLFARTVRRGLRGSAYDLAMWLTANWWRLRWEPEARSVDWRMSHVLAAAGGGFAWPDLSFISNGVHLLIEARKTTDSSVVPVRYLSDLDVQIEAATFEAAVDEFVEQVLARLSSVGIRDTSLDTLWKQLVAERRDTEFGNRRRLEALLGFDSGRRQLS